VNVGVVTANVTAGLSFLVSLSAVRYARRQARAAEKARHAHLSVSVSDDRNKLIVTNTGLHRASGVKLSYSGANDGKPPPVGVNMWNPALDALDPGHAAGFSMMMGGQVTSDFRVTVSWTDGAGQHTEEKQVLASSGRRSSAH
jgi:hypothetical protein